MVAQTAVLVAQAPISIPIAIPKPSSLFSTLLATGNLTLRVGSQLGLGGLSGLLARHGSYFSILEAASVGGLILISNHRRGSAVGLTQNYRHDPVGIVG